MSPEPNPPEPPPADVAPWHAQGLATFTTSLAARGFDLVATCSVADYDRRVPAEFRFADPLARHEPPVRADDVIVLIGASRTIWPAFAAALAREPARRLEAHPFDRWSSEVIATLVADLPPSRVVDLRMVFEGPPHAFAAQHLAEATGLACRGPAALSVHPIFGPWFALRAALVLRGVGAVPASQADPICDRCPTRACVPALEHALGESRRPASPPDHGQVREQWRLWLAVRDACPVGREYRYSENQIRWHYAHDRSALV